MWDTAKLLFFDEFKLMHLKSVLCRHHCPGACNFQTNILLIIKIKWQKWVPNLRWKSLFLSCVLLCHTLQYYSAFLTRKASVPSKKCIFSIKIKINMILWKFWKNAYFNLFNAGPFPNKVFSNRKCNKKRFSIKPCLSYRARTVGKGMGSFYWSIVFGF